MTAAWKRSWSEKERGTDRKKPQKNKTEVKAQGGIRVRAGDEPETVEREDFLFQSVHGEMEIKTGVNHKETGARIEGQRCE